MSLIDAFILGLVQGITEFLPVSSSGHLKLTESFLKLDAENLKSFDIALHFGTFLAILLYFKQDFIKLWRAFWFSLFTFFRKIQNKANPPQKHTDHDLAEIQQSQKLILFLILATLPSIIGGLFLGDLLDHFFGNSSWILFFLATVGILFIVVEIIQKKITRKPLKYSNALMIGLAQACALIPGVSRSGATISAGLLFGLKREEAAKFSFLLGAIAIFAASTLTIIKVLKGTIVLVDLPLLLTGIFTSFVVSLIVISFFMKFIRKHTLIVFGVYRIFLALIIALYFKDLF